MMNARSLAALLATIGVVSLIFHTMFSLGGFLPSTDVKSWLFLFIGLFGLFAGAILYFLSNVNKE